MSSPAPQPAQPAQPLLQVSGVAVDFGNICALGGIDLTVAEGELMVLLGPSGCGKSTLLRAIAGLQPLNAGQVKLKGKDLLGKRPDERGIGLMFQDEVLFPHFDVAGNIEFGLRMQGWSRLTRELRIAEMLELVGLRGFDHRDVATLSGGEAQRVGLARAIAPRPDLLLLDEPFGALDRPLRERLIGELGPLLAAQGVTAIHVTHDHDEALALGHRLAIMLAGQLAAVGTPEQVWTQPGLVEVARFLGHHNTFEINHWHQMTGIDMTDTDMTGTAVVGNGGSGAGSGSGGNGTADAGINGSAGSGGAGSGGAGSAGAEFGRCTHIGVRSDLIELRPASEPTSARGTGGTAAGADRFAGGGATGAGGGATSNGGTGRGVGGAGATGASARGGVAARRSPPIELSGRVISSRFAGARYETHVEAHGDELNETHDTDRASERASQTRSSQTRNFEVASRNGFPPGTEVRILIPRHALMPLNAAH